MKLVSNVLEGMEGIHVLYVISLLLFMVLFIVILVRTLRRPAAEMNEIAERTRQRKVARDEMRGGTFTVTNLGGIGGTAFTPIVNAPEVAILSMEAIVKRPVVVTETGMDVGQVVRGHELVPCPRLEGGQDRPRLVRVAMEGQGLGKLARPERRPAGPLGGIPQLVDAASDPASPKPHFCPQAIEGTHSGTISRHNHLFGPARQHGGHGR